jgi:hypothetical protein
MCCQRAKVNATRCCNDGTEPTAAQANKQSDVSNSITGMALRMPYVWHYGRAFQRPWRCQLWVNTAQFVPKDVLLLAEVSCQLPVARWLNSPAHCPTKLGGVSHNQSTILGEVSYIDAS